MNADDGKKWGGITLSDGGKARDPVTPDVQLERALRALFFAMRGRDGKSVNKNFRNVACGHTKLIRAYMRRIKELRATRNHAHNYPLAKQSVREIDAWVDAQFISALRDNPKAS